jgi:ParB-like chromosome segregation protein Spo0J
VASVKRHNVLLPLLVQRHSGRYRIIDGQKRLAAAIAAGLEEVPCLLHDVEEADAAALAEAANVRDQPLPIPARPALPAVNDDVAESVAAVAGAAHLLSRAAGSLSRVAALNLINAETWRAECLLDSARLAEGKRRVASTTVSPFRIVEAAARHVGAEARLRSARVEVRTVDVPLATQVYTDEALLVRALSLFAISTLALLESVADAHITIRVAVRGNRAVAFEVFQDSVAAPASWFAPAAAPADGMATAPAAGWMAAARQIADALGAQVSVAPAGTAGTVATLALPSVKE